MNLIFANRQVNKTHSIFKLFIIKTRKLKIFDVQVYTFLRNEILCGFPKNRYDKILVTMIIGIGLYRPSIRFFFITKMIYTMVVDHDHYKWLLGQQLCVKMTFFTIMCQNYGSLGKFFFIVFLQQFKSYKDHFWAVVIVCLTIFKECLFCLSFFLPLLEVL